MLTLIALAITIFIARREHRMARDALTEQHALLREQAARGHLIDLLLQIQEQVSIVEASSGKGLEERRAQARLRGLLAAVPAGELPLARLKFARGEESQRDEWSALARQRGHDLQLGWDRNPDESVLPEVATLILKTATP